MLSRGIWRASALVSLASFWAACGGDNPAPSAGLSITSPEEGAAFSAEDDVNAAAAGLQIELAMLVTNLDDEGAVLVTREGPTPRQTEILLEGTERATTVTSEVTLLDGSNTIRVELLDGDDETVLETSVTISADTSGISEPPQIAITAPQDGATLTSADDLDTTTDGLQIEVVVETQNVTEGRGITLSSSDFDAITQQVAGGVATFEVTLLEGDKDLTAAVTIGGDTYIDDVSVTVQLDEEPDTCSVEIFPPLVDSPCQFSSQNTDADPDTEGFQVDFSANTTCATVELLLDGNSLGTANTVAGTAEFPAVTIPEDVFTIEAVATDPEANEGSASQIYNADFTGPVATFDDTTLGARLPGDDDDPDTDGLQTSITGTFANDDSANVSLSVDGEPVDDVFVESGPGFTFDGVTFGASGTYTIAVSAEDSCGNAADGDEAEIQIFLEEPDISITDPSTGDLLNAAMDADTETDGFQVAFTVSGALATGSTVAVECSPAGDDSFTEIGTAEVDDDGRATVVADFEDGNVDCRPTASAPVELVGPAVSFGVDATIPELILTSPEDGLAYGSTDVQVTATIDNTTDGEVLTATWNGTDIAGGELTITDGAIDETISVSEGENTIRVAVSDAAGNEDSVEVTFTVDATAPTIEITSLTDGASLIVADDEDLGTAGFQHTLTLASDAEDGSEATVVITDESGPGTPFNIAIAGGTGSSAVVLPEGAISVEATIRDDLDNVSSDSVDVSVDSVAPTGTFVVPAIGDTAIVTPADDADSETPGLQFTVEIDVADIEDGQPLVLVSSTAGTLAEVTIDDPSSAQEITFTVTEPGVQELGATLTDASGNETVVNGGEIDVQIDGCGLAFADLAGDPVYFNIAGDADADPSNGYDTDIAVEVASGACDGVEASLLVDGGSVATATITGSTLTFADVNFSDGTSGTLQAEATFPGGDAPAQTETINFITDVTAPTIDSITPGADGAETPIGIADAGAGGVGTIDLTLATTGADTYDISDDSSSLSSGAADTGSVDLPGFAISEGAITLTFTVMDEAGNMSVETRDYLVDFSAPEAVTFTLEQINRRSGETRVMWTGSDTISTYEIRTSPTEITEVNWSDLDGDPNSIIVPATPGAMEHVYDFLEPFQMDHYIAMRATDVVGNVGPVAGDSVFVGLLEERIASVVAQDNVVAAGDLNGDGYDDFVAGGLQLAGTTPVSAKPLQIYYGGESTEDFTVVTVPQPDPSGAPFWGSYFDCPGDVDGDGVADLLVIDPLSFEAYLFFGSVGAGISSTTVTLSFDTAGAGTLGVGITAGPRNFVRRPGEDRPFDDLVLFVELFAGQAGTVFVVAGRPREDWPSELSFGGTAVDDLSNGVGRIRPDYTGARFGRAIYTIGDLDGDGLDELAIASRGGSVPASALHVFAGREMTCGADCVFPDSGLLAVLPGSACPADERCQLGVYTGRSVGAFWGIDAAGVGHDADGDGVNDLILVDSSLERFEFYLGASLGPDTFNFEQNAGSVGDFTTRIATVGDLRHVDEDTYSDLVAIAANESGSRRAVLLLNDGTGLFDLSSSINLVSSDVFRADDIGDFNGDGLPDLAIQETSTPDMIIFY